MAASIFTTRDKQPIFEAPGMGENISAIGMTEENVCIGDQYQWGETASKRLETNTVENWNFRLLGHP